MRWSAIVTLIWREPYTATLVVVLGLSVIGFSVWLIAREKRRDREQAAEQAWRRWGIRNAASAPPRAPGVRSRRVGR